MVKNNEPSPQQAKFRVGDLVKFKLEKQTFEGKIEKGYTNSFLISFKTTDPAMMDKYHDKVVINNKKLKITKKVPRDSKNDPKKADKDSTDQSTDKKSAQDKSDK